MSGKYCQKEYFPVTILFYDFFVLGCKLQTRFFFFKDEKEGEEGGEKEEEEDIKQQTHNLPPPKTTKNAHNTED